MVIQIGTDNQTKDEKKAVILAHITVFSVASRRNLGTLVQLAVLRGPKSRALVGVRLGTKHTQLSEYKIIIALTLTPNASYLSLMQKFSFDHFQGHFWGVSIAFYCYHFGSKCDAGFRINIFDLITTTSFKIEVFQMLIMTNTFSQNDTLI